MTRKKRWNRAQSDLCPLCKQKTENNLHVFQCTHSLINLHRSKCLTHSRTSLQRYKTSPLSINHVCRILHQVCGGFPVSKLDVNSDTESDQNRSLSQAIDIQIEKLGLKNI